jgi:magnesium transporter
MTQVASRAWRDGRIVDEHLDPGGAAAALRAGCLLWIDLVDPGAAELAAVVAELGIPGAAVESALAPFERPKVVRHESHRFFTVYATSLAPPGGEGERLRAQRISGIVLPSALVTIRDGGFSMAPVEAGWRDNADLLSLGSGALLHGLFDVVVDSHFDTIGQLDDIVEDLEDELFAQAPTGREFARTVFHLRKDLVRLRRLVLPMREVVTGVRHAEPTGTLLDLQFEDLAEHVLRASEWTESLRDMITSLFEANLSLQDARLNEIMKKLAAWAAIIAVPTAITGWFGQNLPYPGFGDGGGVLLSAGLIVLMSAALWAVFRRRGWL